MRYGRRFHIPFVLVWVLVFSVNPQKAEAGFFCNIFGIFCGDTEQTASVSGALEKEEIVVYSVDGEPGEQPLTQTTHATTVIEKTVIQDNYPTYVTHKYFTYTGSSVTHKDLEQILVEAKAFANLANDKNSDRSSGSSSGSSQTISDLITGTLAAGELLYATDADTVVGLNVGSDGEVLTLSGGVPTWAASGGSGGTGTWSTTTSGSQTINSPIADTDIVTIGSNSTSTAEFWFNPGSGMAYIENRLSISTTSAIAEYDINIDRNSNGGVGIGIVNPNDGTQAYTAYNARNDYGGSAEFGVGSSGFTQGAVRDRAFWSSDSSLNGMSLINENPSSDIRFYIGGSSNEVMRIDSSGNVGIGTTTPLRTLDVEGDFGLTGAFYDNTDSAGTIGMVLQTTGTGIQWVATSSLGISGGGGGGTFISLSDTQNSFTANRIPYTNSGASSLTDSANFEYDGLDLTVNGGYKSGSEIILAASSTNFSTLVGRSAGESILGSGNYNTAVGYQALADTTSGGSNTGVGRQALYKNTVGVFNTAVGVSALSENLSSGYNTALGVGALRLNTAAQNTAVGFNALNDNVGGTQNSALGVSALESNTSGSKNTAHGMDTLINNTVANNTVAVGYRAGAGTGSYSAGELTLLGTEALYNITTGADDNTAVGYQAGYSNTSGANNLYFGYQTGDNVTIGSNNIIIGYDIDAPNATGDGQLSIGNLIFGTGLSATGTDVSSGSIGIGTSSPSTQFHTTGGVRFENLGSAGANLTTDAAGNVTASSDERLKTVLRGYNDSSVEALLGIEPIQYKWAEHSGFETETVYTGFSAQNVREFIPEAIGVDKKGYLTLSERPMLATVINAIKEMWAKITQNEDRIENLEQRIIELENELDVEPRIIEVIVVDDEEDEEETAEETEDPTNTEDEMNAEGGEGGLNQEITEEEPVEETDNTETEDPTEAVEPATETEEDVVDEETTGTDETTDEFVEEDETETEEEAEPEDVNETDEEPVEEKVESETEPEVTEEVIE